MGVESRSGNRGIVQKAVSATQKEKMMAGTWMVALARSILEVLTGEPIRFNNAFDANVRERLCIGLLCWAQSCLTLCNPMDCSALGSSVHGILQARILEWVAMPSSRGSSNPRIEPVSLETYHLLLIYISWQIICFGYFFKSWSVHLFVWFFFFFNFLICILLL